MSNRVVDPAQPQGITVITSSYKHTGHLDAETLQPTLATNNGVQMIIPEANRDSVSMPIGRNASLPHDLWNGHSFIVV